ncbi:unnamed protein product [Symbiodinium sp. CCMP2592]|nr:unnamed protein product [Symbiodinium sp. CCMP2592]
MKPENLLLTEEGRVKLADMGIAKFIGNHKTYTMVGTPDYLAPETIRGVGQAYGVDWWTLGVLCFELLAGSTQHVPRE